jgi:protein-S-isoprenylcysteine O-methyltransferase Ste14
MSRLPTTTTTIDITVATIIITITTITITITIVARRHSGRPIRAPAPVPAGPDPLRRLGDARVPSRMVEKMIAITYGTGCHALFVLGVGIMIYEMAFGMSRSLGTISGAWLYVTDAALLLQFPLCHSLLLSRCGHKILAQLAPFGLGGRLSTTSYAIIASAQIGLLFLLWSPSRIIWWQAEGWWLVASGLLYLTAWLLLLKSIVDAGFPLQTGLLGWWAVVRGRKPVYPPMPHRGLFRLVRQPIYVAFAMTLWTVPTWTPDQLAVAITLTLYCLLGPLFKEARFLRAFGGDFARYQRRVPYWLPWPRPSGTRLP